MPCRSRSVCCTPVPCSFHPFICCQLPCRSCGRCSCVHWLSQGTQNAPMCPTISVIAHSVSAYAEERCFNVLLAKLTCARRPEMSQRGLPRSKRPATPWPNPYGFGHFWQVFGCQFSPQHRYCTLVYFRPLGGVSSKADRISTSPPAIRVAGIQAAMNVCGDDVIPSSWGTVFAILGFWPWVGWFLEYEPHLRSKAAASLASRNVHVSTSTLQVASAETYTLSKKP